MPCFQPRVTESRTDRFRLSAGDSTTTLGCQRSFIWRMLRLTHSLFHVAHTHTSYSLHRSLTKISGFAMESESTTTTGTHRDPVTGEMISKQYALTRISLCVLLMIHLAQRTQASPKATRKGGKEGRERRQSASSSDRRSARRRKSFPKCMLNFLIRVQYPAIA